MTARENKVFLFKTLRQRFFEHRQRAAPGKLCGFAIVALTGVVEERVIGTLIDVKLL